MSRMCVYPEACYRWVFGGGGGVSREVVKHYLPATSFGGSNKIRTKGKFT